MITYKVVHTTNSCLLCFYQPSALYIRYKFLISSSVWLAAPLWFSLYIARSMPADSSTADKTGIAPGKVDNSDYQLTELLGIIITSPAVHCQRISLRVVQSAPRATGQYLLHCCTGPAMDRTVH